MDDLEKNINAFGNELQKLRAEKKNLEKEPNKEKVEKFLKYLDELEIIGTNKYDKIIKLKESMAKEIEDTCLFFGEDKAKFELSKFIKLISDFSNNFQKVALKQSEEAAKLLKKQIKDDKTKKQVDPKNKFSKDLQKIKESVARKTNARKSIIKNLNLNKEAIESLDDTEIMDKSSAKVFKKYDLHEINESPSKKAKSPNIIQNKKEAELLKQMEKKTRERVSKARITKFKKSKLDLIIDSGDENNNDDIDNDFLLINQPLEINKLTHLNQAHKSKINIKIRSL